MIRFIHSADIHLDSPLLRLEHYEGAPVDALRGATRKALQNLVGLAIAESVDFVLISGDLYDGSWKDYNTGLYFVSRMAKLREAGIQVFIIAGNHDAASKMTKTLRYPENVHFFPTDKPDTIRLDKLGVAIHGQGFATPAVRKDLSVAYPAPIPGYFNIGMLHTGANGNHEPYAPCTVEGLRAKGYDYWALGHVHTRETLSYEPLIVFPANIQGRNILETGPRGCMMVSVNDSAVNAEFRPLDVIRWEKIQVQSDILELLNCIDVQMQAICERNEGLPTAVRIEITGNSEVYKTLAAQPEQWKNDIRALASDSGEGRIWVEKIIFPQQPVESGSYEIHKGPVGEIFQIFAELQSDPSSLKAMADSLNDLLIKLPRELREGSEAIFPNDRLWIKDMLKEAEPMLIQYLNPRLKP